MLFNINKKTLEATLSWSRTNSGIRSRCSEIISGLVFGLLLAGLSPAAVAGEKGRLEADADFVLGRWSSDCAAGEVHIFLRDGALRQQGLLRLSPKGGGKPITPVTLLAATRDGPGLVLEADSKEGGFRSSARYTAHIGSDQSLVLKSMTLCHDKQCRSVTLDVPWSRCAK